MFSTRDPEEPENTKSTYIPPTEPETVIDNLVYAIKEKNTENYISCLMEKSESDDNPNFEFIPSTDVKALYYGLFDFWDIESERKSFFSFISKVDEAVLTISDEEYDRRQDSTLLTCNYHISLVHTVSDLPDEFAGSMQLTFVQDSYAYWSILRWTDIKSENDTINSTWSLIKAMFEN